MKSNSYDNLARVCCAAFALVASTAAAQGYPSKVVRLLIPFSAGSGSDTIGRIYAGGLAEAFGQQVIVENRAGAAGNIGAEIAARACRRLHALSGEHGARGECVHGP